MTSARLSSVSVSPPPVWLCSASAVAKKRYSGSRLRSAISRSASSSGHPDARRGRRAARTPRRSATAASRATARIASAIGMPTRTARTIIASASGNCPNSVRLRRRVAPAEEGPRDSMIANGRNEQPARAAPSSLAERSQPRTRASIRAIAQHDPPAAADNVAPRPGRSRTVRARRAEALRSVEPGAADRGCGAAALGGRRRCGDGRRGPDAPAPPLCWRGWPRTSRPLSPQHRRGRQQRSRSRRSGSGSSCPPPRARRPGAVEPEIRQPLMEAAAGRG